jgi:hypothetical protein
MPKKPPKEVLIQRNRATIGLDRANEVIELRLKIAELQRRITELERQIPANGAVASGR